MGPDLKSQVKAPWPPLSRCRMCGWAQKRACSAGPQGACPSATSDLSPCALPSCGAATFLELTEGKRVFICLFLSHWIC